MIAQRLAAAGACFFALLLAWPARAGEHLPKHPVAPTVDTDGMIAFEAGTFRRGHPGGSPRPYGDPWLIDQLPEHEVSLPAFRVDAHEVTVAEFALFLTYAGGELHFHPNQPVERVEGGYLPVVGTDGQAIRQVTWQAADDYCRWVGKRLPTEAEWERAAAGTDDRTYPWGEEGARCDRAAVYTGRTFCVDQPVEVGTHPAGATPEGVHDLAGNVGEWTADWYGPYPTEAQVDPRGPDEGAHKVVRGGGFLESGTSLRTHTRRPVPPTARADDLGFRCAWREDVEDRIGAERRGTLAAAEDVAREPTPRPRSDAAPRPEVLASDLDGPTAIVEVGGRWVVVESGAARVVAIGADGTVTPLLEGLTEPADLAVDGADVIVTDRGTGSLWRIADDGTTTELVTGENAPGRVIADGGEIWWGTANAVRRLGTAGAEDVLTGLDGVVGLALDAEWLWIAVEGAASPSASRIARVRRLDGTVETVLDSASFGARMRATDVTLGPDGELVYGLRMDGFPNSSLVCVLPVGASAERCHYGPVGVGRVAVGGGWLWWATTRAVVRLPFADAAARSRLPYEVPGLWTSPAGLLIASDGAMVWTDDHAGRIHRVAD